jgi:hypothetical protein
MTRTFSQAWEETHVITPVVTAGKKEKKETPMIALSNCHLAHFSAETGLYASEVKTGDDMRQSLSQELALFHGITTCLPSPDAYGLSAPI